jgi:hypothetical protein
MLNSVPFTELKNNVNLQPELFAFPETFSYYYYKIRQLIKYP